MKNFLLVVSFFVFFGCNSHQKNLIKLQNEHLEKSIKESIVSLNNSVKESGNRRDGVLFLRHAVQLKDRLDSISEQLTHSSEENVIKLTEEFIEFANSAPDSIELHSEFLYKSLDDFNTENRLDLNNNLRLFTLNAIRKYHDKFNSYFLKYDLISVKVIPDNLNPKAGDSYNADIFIGATRVGVNPIIKVDFLDDDTGYYEIPVEDAGVGKLKISKLKKGTTRLKVQILELYNDEEITFERELTIDAK